MKINNTFKFIIAIGVSQLAGVIGSVFTVSSIPTWYAELQKPSFSPPNRIFGPAWILLYILMGISVYLIWSSFASADAKALADKKASAFGKPSADKSDGQSRKLKIAFWLFWIHLVFNATWSIIFFGLHSPGLAFINIIIIWLLIVVLMIKFWKINKWATYLLIPYLLWVSFASLLNYFIWYLN